MPAQQFPPGYVDPAPLLAAVAEEIGEANLRCIMYSGAGYSGAPVNAHIAQNAMYSPPRLLHSIRSLIIPGTQQAAEQDELS